VDHFRAAASPGAARPRRARGRSADCPRNQREAEARTARETSVELLDKLARLEERVKVLERIVTDDPAELRRQFRDLGG
jgi:hypothetical protein